MPRYSYSALSQTGVLTRGEEVAASSEELVRQLSDRGFIVQKVKAASPVFRRSVATLEDLRLFTQEFVALIRAGLTIPDALGLVVERPGNAQFSDVLRRVFEDVRSGVAFSEACARHPDVFDTLYISALRTGEKTGDLRTVLSRYQEYLHYRLTIRKKVGRALAYPLFLLISLVVILAVLFAFVLPRFVAMYADFGAKLPWATQILLEAVNNAPMIVAFIALLGGVGWIVWRRWTSTELGRLAVDRWKERLPYFGEVQRDMAVSQFARALGALLAGGTPLVEALQSVQGAISNRSYADRLGTATEQVSHGGSLAQSLRSQFLIPQTAGRMIEVGEASGNLEGMLSDVASFYEEKLDNRLSRLMTLMEPALMLVMGLFIGGIIIVMYLPIFNMADVIR